jgi:NitT/TauT family transport system ATP-binding protein
VPGADRPAEGIAPDGNGHREATGLALQGETATAIEVRDLVKVYPTAHGPVRALDRVSFTVGDGEFVCVVGPSGCGKSTAMMVVAGLRDHQEGSVRVFGNEVTAPVADIGIVFQSDVLLDWRNNLDNVLLQVQFRGHSPSAYRDRAMELLEQVGLAGFEKRRPYELSGGMRQRVSICRALIHDPRILLMDEPFGALDALTREQMTLDLQHIWLNRRKSVLFITHSIPEAVLLSDRVVVMTPRPGRVDTVIPIDLPRPRTLEIEGTREFGDYTRQIREIFQRRGVIHDVDEPAGT